MNALTDADLVARFRELAKKVDHFQALMRQYDAEPVNRFRIAAVANIALDLIREDLAGDWWRQPSAHGCMSGEPVAVHVRLDPVPPRIPVVFPLRKSGGAL